MKVGSLVVCLNNSEWENSLEKFGFFVKRPEVKKVVYTVRGFYASKNSDHPSIYLEEIVNEPLQVLGVTIVEPSFYMDHFEEVLPPMNILEQIEKDCEEAKRSILPIIEQKANKTAALIDKCRKKYPNICNPDKWKNY